MCEVPVFYTTTEGQTRRIAQRIAEELRWRGLDSVALDVTTREAEALPWEHLRGAVVGASLHGGRHQPAASAFLRAHANWLNERPSAFFSVSLSAGSANAHEVAAARDLAQAFVTGVGWHPRQIACFTGCLAYTQYGFLKKHLMRWIATKKGASTDTTRDHEFTDWGAVVGFSEQIAAEVRERNETLAQPA
jgi:menaquinone-dependent protoporphyrinogen oxidase